MLNMKTAVEGACKLAQDANIQRFQLTSSGTVEETTPSPTISRTLTTNQAISIINGVRESLAQVTTKLINKVMDPLDTLMQKLQVTSSVLQDTVDKHFEPFNAKGLKAADADVRQTPFRTA